MSIRRRRHTPQQESPRRPRQRAARGSLFSRVGGGIARALLRLLFLLPRRLAQPRLAQSGFILPTVVLLLLVVTLTVGSITLRTFTRTTQAIGDRQQQVIYNAATPAIDRAKAKLEYLFNQDERLPSGTPGETFLFGMMANDGQNGVAPRLVPPAVAGPGDISPYNFEDETPIDLDGNAATNDNAWQFPVDTDGDGGPDAVIAYSVLFQTPENINELSDRSEGAVAGRAAALQVKNGPLSSTASVSSNCARAAGAVEEGWFKIGSNDPSKNFQVNAIAIPGNVGVDGTLQAADAIATIATLEFQQDRKVEQGNKWGAWFRNDLEIFPGPEFRWNGAMHTEGNLIVGQGNGGGAKFRAFLISSTDSCLNTSKADSEVTLGDTREEPRLGENEGIPFQGQVINGRVANPTYDQQSFIHIFGEENPLPGAPELNDGSDSLVNDAPPVADFALDPVRLLAEGISISRNVEDVAGVRDAAWNVEDATPEIEERIRSESEDQPLVGDSYRADNREGPQPRYSDIEVTAVGAPTANVDLVNPGLAGDTEVGLDGYWERRARNEGMRIVVGQRLELGDPYGWDATDESLYPFELCTPSTIGCHETRQRRTLSDHLAAVQATAIYRATGAGSDGDLPRVCLATTVHPGTAKTLQDSATFEALQIIEPRSGIASQAVLTDFFTGRGTNGWEFDFPYGADFATAIGAVEPLGIGLRNLAQFAGDLDGGAPSFEPVQDDFVHPYPLMSMWGDFSALRNVIALLDGGTAYAALSPADKTTLHTAACTLGMLAYNVDYLNRFEPDSASNTEYGPGGTAEDGAIATLVTRLASLTTGTGLPTEIAALDPTDPPEAFISALEQWNQLLPAPADPVSNAMLAIARVIVNKEQVNRDRLNGFGAGPGTYVCTPYVDANMEMLCADGPKYPILRALFPPGDVTALAETADETRDGAVDAYISAQNGGLSYEATTPVAPGSPVTDLLNNVDTLAIAPRNDPSAGWVTPIATAPFETAASDATPVNPSSNQLALIRCIDEACGTGSLGTETWQVPFKDSALYDGRERMNVRALDVDLGLLRENNFLGEPWLPLSGIVFAFREDAAREDAIVRPAAGALCADYTTLAANLATCQTHADGDALAGSTDPQLLDGGFSMKAVDFIADPDRRPYAFRLINGITLKRDGDFGRGMSFISDNSVYIRGGFNLHQGVIDPDPDDDDPGVIEQLEEFVQPLDPNWGNFYTRDIPNNNFANPSIDDWRPTEVLADAVTILSSNFCDGSIEDSFTTAGENNLATLPTAFVEDNYGCVGPDHTSYLNQNRPRTAPGADWQRQNPVDPGSPIVVDKNGVPVESDGTPYAGNYYTQEENSLITAAEQIVNLSVISGIVPSRFEQSYGGLHNFPRLNESWQLGPPGTGGRPNVTLSMAGTFYQLNFSTAATAPFDQEVWEPEDPPTRPQDILPYYNPPERRWGYDVALQYVPAAPIASRFATSTPARSEFYSEPTLDDPYIAQLCRQVAGDDSFCPPG